MTRVHDPPAPVVMRVRVVSILTRAIEVVLHFVDVQVLCRTPVFIGDSPNLFERKSVVIFVKSLLPRPGKGVNMRFQNSPNVVISVKPVELPSRVGCFAFKCSVDTPIPDVEQCTAKLSCVSQSAIGSC